MWHVVKDTEIFWIGHWNNQKVTGVGTRYNVCSSA